MKTKITLLAFFVLTSVISYPLAVASAQANPERSQLMNQAKAEPFVLPALPYKENALEPVISERTLSFHYGKHHRGYLNKLNELVEGTELAEVGIEELIEKTANKADQAAIFNNAAQVWNHTFYWNSLRPAGGGQPAGSIAKRIVADFGSFENFVKQFSEMGAAQFGSGWVWLVEEDGVLKIIRTSNAENPISQKKGRAILVLDVWEHAYYLDYQNRRLDYLKVIIDKLINWEFAEENLNRNK